MNLLGCHSAILSAAIKREVKSGGEGKWETSWFPASLFSHPPHLCLWCRISRQNHSSRLFIHRDYYLNDMAWQRVTQQIQSFFQLNPFNYMAGVGCCSYQWTGPYCTSNHVLWEYLCTVLWCSHSNSTFLNFIWSCIKTLTWLAIKGNSL